MKTIIAFCVSLAFLFAVTGGANASLITNFLTQSPSTSFNSGNNPIEDPGPPVDPFFSDQYMFRVDTTAALIQLTTILQGSGKIDTNPASTDKLTVRLFTSNTINVNSLDNFKIAATQDPANQNKYDLSFSPLNINTQYVLTVDGKLLAPEGNYTVLFDVLAVPLPPAAILFLSALAGLAGFSRIRRRKAMTT